MTTAVLSRKALLVQGASIGYLAGKLAADAKPDLTPIFANVTHANFKASKAAIVAGVADATKGKLAGDAKLDDFPAFLGAFDEAEPAEEKKVEKKAEDEEDETEEEKEARLKKEREAKDKAKDKKAKDKAAKDAENPFAKKDEEDKKDDKAAKDADLPITKEAMDEAVQSAAKSAETRILARMKGARDAEAFVRPWVGQLAIAYDSAEEIERATAIVLKIPGADKVHHSALRSLISLMPKPGERPRDLAHDARPRGDSDATGFSKRFPDAQRIRVL